MTRYVYWSLTTTRQAWRLAFFTFNFSHSNIRNAFYGADPIRPCRRKSQR